MSFFVKPELRGCDPQGCGHYLASRGRRKHKGIDLKVEPEQEIFSAVEGRVAYIGYPYKGKKFTLIEIRDKFNYKHRYFYVKTNLKPGNLVSIGDCIGVAQDRAADSPGMINHVHYEVKLGDEKLNPEKFL